MSFNELLEFLSEEEKAIVREIPPLVRTMLFYRSTGMNKHMCYMKATGRTINQNSATAQFNKALSENPGYEIYLDALQRVKEHKAEVSARDYHDILYGIASGNIQASQPFVLKKGSEEVVEFHQVEPSVSERLKSAETGLKHMTLDKVSSVQLSFVEDI